MENNIDINGLTCLSQDLKRALSMLEAAMVVTFLACTIGSKRLTLFRFHQWPQQMCSTRD